MGHRELLAQQARVPAPPLSNSFYVMRAAEVLPRDHRACPEYQVRRAYCWYHPDPRFGVGLLSSSEAHGTVRRSGYSAVAAVNCSGRTYMFEAIRNGRRVTAYVNARTGRVWRR
jgi:hypothetical protein